VTPAGPRRTRAVYRRRHGTPARDHPCRAAQQEFLERIGCTALGTRETSYALTDLGRGVAGALPDKRAVSEVRGLQRGMPGKRRVGES